MQYSENYNMNKPDRADQYNLDHWNENTDIIDTQLKSQEDRIAQNESDIDDLNSLILTFIASNTTLSGVTLNAGNTVKVLFDTDIIGNDNTTGLSITYNNVNIPIKVNKNGDLVDFTATEISTNVYKYLQKNTVIEFIYDGAKFIINGNPIVLSGNNYTVYANGYNSKHELIWDGSNWTPSGSSEELTFTHEISENSILLIEMKPYINSSTDELTTFTVPLNALINGQAFLFTGHRLQGSSGTYTYVDWGWRLSIATTTYIKRGNGISQQYNDGNWGVPYRIWLL